MRSFVMKSIILLHVYFQQEKVFFFSKRLSLNVYIKYKVKYPRANEDDILSNNQTLTQ